MRPDPRPRIEALFVHGMGRSPLSGWPMLQQLRRAGVETSTFGYVAGMESFSRITERLASRLLALAERGEYVLVGHSLGGVLLRAALKSMPAGTRQPRHVFLLGSPVEASRLAQRLRANLAYRLLTGECGQLLGSTNWMRRARSGAGPDDEHRRRARLCRRARTVRRRTQ